MAINYVTVPPGFGLGVTKVASFLATAEGPFGLDRDDETGWRAGSLTGWTVYDPCGDFDEAVDGVTRVDGGFPKGMPFAIQAEDVCSTGGDRSDRSDRARALLERVTSAALAREFWTGTLRDAAGWQIGPRLAEADDIEVLTSGTAVSVKRAVQLLIGAAAPALMSRVVLHMTPETFMALDQSGTTLTPVGDLITTIRQDYVCADPGYPGTGPDGADPTAGEGWIYATARPVVHLGDVIDGGEVVDRANNNIRAQAERPALTTVVPGVWAAQVTLT